MNPHFHNKETHVGWLDVLAVPKIPDTIRFPIHDNGISY